MHEDVAVSQYQDITGPKVKPAGLYLFWCGFLVCSPDGIIETPSEGAAALGNNGLSEVKCPWKYRNAHIYEILNSELKEKEKKDSFYLAKDKKLHKEHNYWFQVQAEMAAVGAEWAHFVIWTTKGIEIIEVERDINWEEQYLPLLAKFYLNELLPSICTDESAN